jgi:hypothetical protein
MHALLDYLFKVLASRAALRADVRRFQTFVDIIADDTTPLFHALLLLVKCRVPVRP